MTNTTEIPGDSILTSFQPISVGEILFSFKEFLNIFDHKLKKDPQTFSSIPIKIVIKRISNGMVVDLLGIRRIEMNQQSSCIWFICFANKNDSIFIHNKSIVKLKLSTKPVCEISDAFNFFKKVFQSRLNGSVKDFYNLPVRLAVVNESDGMNEEVIDVLDIATLLLDDIGSGIFCHSLIDDVKMINGNPNIEKLLDESEKKYSALFKKLNSKF